MAENWRDLYNAKVMTAEEAVTHIKVVIESLTPTLEVYRFRSLMRWLQITMHTEM